MKRIIFNGSIYATGRKDGIPRYATEIVKALDSLDDVLEYEIVTPVPLDFDLKRIKETIIGEKLYASGKLGAEIWKQILFVNYANRQDCIVVDLGMMLPFRRNDVCAIYDCQPERFPENYITGRLSRIINKVRLAQRKNAISKSKIVITDSENAKNDLISYYNPAPEKIKVAYCGWQHFEGIEPDESVFSKYPEILKNGYFFSLGSRFKHKNIEWVIAAAEQNPQYYFLVTGYNNVATYSDAILKKATDNLVFTGYLSDGEIKALMLKCKAFIHPSISEGFGIPPLEALSVGAEIIVSNASCLPEVYEDSAHYIDPNNYEGIELDKILENPLPNRSELLKKYSWRKSAELIQSVLKDLI